MPVYAIANVLKEAESLFKSLPDIAEQAAVMALNQVSERSALPLIREKVLDQVNFPAGYLKQEDRIAVSKKATRGSLEAVITGRDRPTSLARFVSGNLSPENSRGKQLRVRVSKHGGGTTLKKAFLVRLRNGNVGLAVRMKEGSPNKAYKPVALDNNVWLLYGPSVDQVVKDVFGKSIDEIAVDFSAEFFRQFTRLSK